MPSTPDSILRLELQATGENATTWGVKTNNNLELLGQAIAGAANVNVGGSGNYTLVASNYTTDEARAATLVLTGVLSGNRDVIVPSSPKHYTIINQTSGAFPLTIRQVSGTGAAIPAGSSQIVCTSTTCVALNYVSKAGDTMTGALEVNNSITSRGIVPEVKYIETDTGTTIRTLVDDSAWDVRRDDYSVLLSINNSNGQIRAGQNGTAAAPAYSFTGDPDTGIFNVAPNAVGFGLGGVEYLRVDGANLTYTNSNAGGSNSINLTLDGSIEMTRGSGGAYIDFKNVAGEDADARIAESSNGLAFQTGGNGALAVRMTIPGSGAITVSGDLEASGNLRFNSGYGSAAIAYGVRAWVNFNGTGTVAIRASGGVTSITDNGTGDYTVNFNFTMPDTNYAAVGNASPNTATISSGVLVAVIRSTTGVRVLTSDNNTDQLFDYQNVDLIVVR